MIVNGKETPPTPPAQQQANRQQLAEDLRSGRYRQEKIFIHSNDGSRVCVLGAAYETARRVHANGLTIPPLAQAVANESIFQGSKVRGVIADAYGFSTWQRLKLVHKNGQRRLVRTTGESHPGNASRRLRRSARPGDPVAQPADTAVGQRPRRGRRRPAPGVSCVPVRGRRRRNATASALIPARPTPNRPRQINPPGPVRSAPAPALPPPWRRRQRQFPVHPVIHRSVRRAGLLPRGRP